MELRNFLFGLFFVMVSMLDFESDLDEYQKLEIINVSSIRREDLPSDFSDEAFKTVDEFIRKTRDLNYEFVIYFDYVTGEILKCVKGENDNVNLKFEENEFNGCSIASIHNHPKNLLSAPSGLNFGILSRDFEDFELIAGFDNFWILKAKGTYKNMVGEMNFVSEILCDSSLESCAFRYGDGEIIKKMHDIKYGNQLLKFINDKNITNIQLSKKEYVPMDVDLKTASYHCRRCVNDPEEIRLAREREADPNILSGKDKVFALYQLMGMEIDYDEIFAD